MPVNLLAIGIIGIDAAEAQLAATESNIANASNPNYSVESVTLGARPGYLGFGVGVDVLSTDRAQAPFLTNQINTALVWPELRPILRAGRHARAELRRAQRRRGSLAIAAIDVQRVRESRGITE
jgi:hypothetical protein